MTDAKEFDASLRREFNKIDSGITMQTSHSEHILEVSGQAAKRYFGFFNKENWSN